MIRMDQKLVGFDLTLTEVTIESLQHLRGLQRGINSPADHHGATQIDPRSQIPPSSGDAALVDVTSPAPVGGKRGKVLPHQEAL